MAKFQMRPTVGVEAETARVGTKLAPLVDADKGKAVTLAAASQVNLAVADGEIFGFLSSINEGAPSDGFRLGGVVTTGYQTVDTGTAAVGDLVVVDTNPASGTAGLTKVKKATGTPVYQWAVVHPGVIRRV